MPRAGSGECTKQRRLRIQKKKASSSIVQPNQPKAKYGRPKKKKSFNFKPKVPTNAIANNPSVVTRARNAIATAPVVVANHIPMRLLSSVHVVLDRPVHLLVRPSLSEIHRTESKMNQYDSRQVLQFVINVNLPPISNHPTIIHQLSPRNNCKT